MWPVSRLGPRIPTRVSSQSGKASLPFLGETVRDDGRPNTVTLTTFLNDFSLRRAEKLNVDSVGGGELANTIPSR